MKRRWISAALALCYVLAGEHFETEGAWAAPAEAAANQKPNIIVILADDLGYADISAYGIHRIDTPNIDSIGNEGIKFTDGYASAPVCAPSRAGLQTGRYQERFGFEFNNGPALRDMMEGLGLAAGEITIGGRAAQEWVSYRRDRQVAPRLTRINFIRPTAVTTSSWDSCPARLPTSIRFCRAFISGTREARPTRMRPASGLDDIREGHLSQVVEGPNRTVVHNESRYLTEYWADRAVDYIHRNSGARASVLSISRTQRDARAIHGDGQVLQSLPAN